MNEVNARRARLVLWMGDRLRAGIPSRYVASQLGQLSHRIAYSTNSFGWDKGSNATSVGWQVTPCDPIWHVSSGSVVAG